MKLSTLTNPVSALSVQALLSTDNSIVTNRNLIRTKTATINGFDSPEQAKAYFDRETRLREGLWVERDISGALCVRARNLTLKFMKTNVFIYDDYNDVLSKHEIPLAFRYMDFDDSTIRYDFKAKKVVFQNEDAHFSICITRTNEAGILCEFVNNITALRHNGKHGDHDFTIDAPFNMPVEKGYIKSEDHAFQTMRIMAEITMTCDYDIIAHLKKYKLSRQDVKNIQETALYLFEESKGHQGSDNAEVAPSTFFKQGMGYLAHIYLTHAYLDNTVGERNRRDLFDSMSIDEENLFEEFRAMAKASHNWFKFSYCG